VLTVFNFRSSRVLPIGVIAAAIGLAGNSPAASGRPDSVHGFRVSMVNPTTIRATWASGPAKGVRIVGQTIRRDCGGQPTRQDLAPSVRAVDLKDAPAGHTCTITLIVTDQGGTTAHTTSLTLASGSYPAATLGTFGSAVMITPQKVAELKALIARRVEPNYTAWKQLLAEADRDLDAAPEAPKVWHVPNAYEDPAGHYSARVRLQRDANRVYAMGLAYAITGQEKYAAEAARIMDAWTRVSGFSTRDDSPLAFCVHFPAMIFGADLIDHSHSSPAPLDAEFTGLIRRTLPLLSTAYTNTNNWGSWGLLLEVSSAAYLKDRLLYDKAVARYQAIQTRAIDSNGVLVQEVRREDGGQGDGSSGLWYANFTLMPMTYAAEVFRVNGTDVYNYVSSNGGSLEKAWSKVSYWSAYPRAFPYETDGKTSPFSPLLAGYFEILNDIWPNSSAKKVLLENRPTEGRHSLVGVTLTHGDLPLGSAATG
jgi:hypothetical protein